MYLLNKSFEPAKNAGVEPRCALSLLGTFALDPTQLCKPHKVIVHVYSGVFAYIQVPCLITTF